MCSITGYGGLDEDDTINDIGVYIMVERRTVMRPPWDDFVPPRGEGWIQISRELTNESIPCCDIRTTWMRFIPSMELI